MTNNINGDEFQNLEEHERNNNQPMSFTASHLYRVALLSPMGTVCLRATPGYRMIANSLHGDVRNVLLKHSYCFELVNPVKVFTLPELMRALLPLCRA